MDLPELKTARLILRLPTVEDAPEAERFYRENEAHLAPWSPHRAPGYFNARAQVERIVRARADYQRGAAVRLFVLDGALPTRIIGLVNFNDIIRGAAQFCSVGYALDEREQGKGLMTEAVKAAIDYMFDVHNLHRVTANYMPHNMRSGAVLRKLGFTVEGYARDFLLIDGKWQDHILTSLTNSHWRLPAP